MSFLKLRLLRRNLLKKKYINRIIVELSFEKLNRKPIKQARNMRMLSRKNKFQRNKQNTLRRFVKKMRQNQKWKKYN